MRKKILFMILVTLFMVFTGCTDEGKVRVYDDTEETVISHDECSMTAVLTGIDMEHNIISFMDCVTGGRQSLIYHGGVTVKNTFDTEIGINGLSCGMIVDVEYYADTGKLIGIVISDSSVVLKNISKFSADTEKNKAVYKGTSCAMSEYVLAFDGDSPLDIREINTEDQVTLYLYGDKLMSVVIELGHGYVRLENQDSYIGGMVEIGYDVIVPVTDNMLLTVREGDYTLRISKDGYSGSKAVKVVRGRETEVDLRDIAVPTGSVTFNVTPPEAVIYVSGNKIDGNVYTGLYGSYSVKVEAEGYQTFKGSFRIEDTVKSYTINLTKLEDGDDTSSTETSTDNSETGQTIGSETTGNTGTDTAGTGTETGTDTGSTTQTDSGSTEATTTASTEDPASNGYVIKIKAPVGVGVYFDGDYVGKAPVSVPKVAGTHTITLYQTGYLIKSYTIQTTDDAKDDEYSFAALTTLLDLVE